MPEMSFQDFAALEMPRGTLRGQVHIISREHEQTARRLRIYAAMRGDLPNEQAKEATRMLRDLCKISLLEVAQLASAFGWNLEELACEIARGIYDNCPTRAAFLAGQNYPGCTS
jgi:hypothetical protein